MQRPQWIMNFQENDIIDFYDTKKISCGLVLDVDDKRLRILTEQGKETKISASRALMAAKDPGFPHRGSRDEQVGRLRQISHQRDEIKNRIDLRELWEVVVPETAEIGIEDLTDLFFGNQKDVDRQASLLRAIFEDRLYFRIRPDSIEVPSPERVEQALVQRDKERDRSHFLAQCAAFLNRLNSAEKVSAELAPEGLIIMLEEAAFLGREWTAVRNVKEIFSQAGMSAAWDPFRVLVELGAWSEDENVRLRSENVPVDFSLEALADATAVSEKPVADSTEDLTDAHLITIDSVFTRDVDDALSLTRQGDEIIAGIHITDVAHFVDHDSPLDLEIRERATSIYLPEMTIPMIPPVLSEVAASLSEGAVRPAVSALVSFGPDLAMRDFRIVASRVQVKERLSYEEADKRIEDTSSVEAAMHDVARALRKKRVEAGALIFRDPELHVRVAQDGTIEVSKRDRETPSQILVSEMMILTNSLFAQFLRTRNIPAIYRSQPPACEKLDLGEEYDPVATFRCKKALSKGDLGTRPAPHSTLGLDVYTTATSPLRRYTDLLVQRQLKAALEGKPFPLDNEQLENVLTEVSLPLERASSMERERQKYFLLKYLRQRRHEEFEAIVLYRFPKFYLVQIAELALNATLNSAGLSLNPYDRVIIRIDKVNPREDKLSLTPVKIL